MKPRIRQPRNIGRRPPHQELDRELSDPQPCCRGDQAGHDAFGGELHQDLCAPGSQGGACGDLLPPRQSARQE
jgi:hypothetical protein